MPALCNVRDRFVFVSGGGGNSINALQSVERYDISTNSWQQVPPMQIARANHASCSIGDTVYVLCGYNQ